MPAGYSQRLGALVAERNVALREAAERYWSDLSRHEAARLLAVSMRRYAGTAWRYEQHAIISPYPEGSLKDCLWRAMKARARLLSTRQLERVLVGTDDHLSNDPV